MKILNIFDFFQRFYQYFNILCALLHLISLCFRLKKAEMLNFFLKEKSCLDQVTWLYLHTHVHFKIEHNSKTSNNILITYEEVWLHTLKLNFSAHTWRHNITISFFVLKFSYPTIFELSIENPMYFLFRKIFHTL